MKPVRLCGYDLNGYRDLAARNWQVRPGDDEVFGDPHLHHGGLLGAVVCSGDDSGAGWVGGPQAMLAPHGRGGGWGAVGDSQRRLPIRDLIAGPQTRPAALGAAFSGLTTGGRFNACALEDGAADPEATQETLLQAMAAARLSNPFLVWRSVCAALYYIGTLPGPDPITLGIVSQTAQGFALQRLRVLAKGGRAGAILAPERRAAAVVVPSSLGYAARAEQALQAICAGAERADHRAQARAVGEVALGAPTSPEVLRMRNGDWEVLPPPEQLAADTTDLGVAEFAGLRDCDAVLFESLAAGSLRAVSIKACARALGSALIDLPPEAVALGALEAARRMAAGEPVFFDFLPCISTIVYSGLKARSFDLIDASETLEADTLYRSPTPAKLALPAGRDTVSVYLRKQAEPWPRVASIRIDPPPKRATPVLLTVEQKPAAGRARILLRAPELGRQFQVDWQKAEEIQEDWDALIASLHAKPTVPDRLVLPCGQQAWDGRAGQEPVSEVLKRAAQHRNKVNWASLVPRLSARPNGVYCISSDGELPPDLPDGDREMLDQLSSRALEETRLRLRGQGPDNNKALQFLTWQFRRCPSEIPGILLELIEGHRPGKLAPPLVAHAGSWVLIYQGFGRTARDPAQELRLVEAVSRKQVTDWAWRSDTACLAFLMSRSPTLPMQVDRQQIDKMSARVLHEFRQALGGSYTTFNYAPFLLAGILRFREKDPWAFVPDLDPVGAAFLRAVEAAKADLTTRARIDSDIRRRADKLVPILNDLEEVLNGVGGNSNLLLNLYNLAVSS